MGSCKDSHQRSVAVLYSPQDRVVDALASPNEGDQLPGHPSLHVDGIRQAEILCCRIVDVSRNVWVTVGIRMAEDCALMCSHLQFVERCFEQKLWEVERKAVATISWERISWSFRRGERCANSMTTIMKKARTVT